MAAPDPRAGSGTPGKRPAVPSSAPAVPPAPGAPPFVPGQPVQGVPVYGQQPPGAVPGVPYGAPGYPQPGYPQAYPSPQFPNAPVPGAQYPGAQHPSAQYPGAQYPAAGQYPAQYPGVGYPQTQYPAAPGAQYPTGSFPPAAGFPTAPAFPAAQPFGGQQYPVAPMFPGAPQTYPSQPQYPGAPQFPTPAQYQGGYGAPPPAQQPPMPPATFPQAPLPAAPPRPAVRPPVPPGTPSAGGGPITAPQMPGPQQSPQRTPSKSPPPSGVPEAKAAPSAKQASKPAESAKPNSAARKSDATSATPSRPAASQSPVAPAPADKSRNAARGFLDLDEVDKPEPTKPGRIDARAIAAAGPQYRAGELLEDDEALTPQELLKKHSIPLVASFFIHMAIVVALGLWSFPKVERSLIVLEASIEEPVDTSMVDMSPITMAADDLNVADFRPLAKLPEPPKRVSVPINPLGVGQAGIASAISIPNDAIPTAALAGRGQMKGDMLRTKGGTAQTEAAVEDALRWIAAHQLPSGLWSLTGDPQGGKGKYSGGAQIENQEAATAMALLAFFGAGHTPQGKSPHAKVVAAGLKALVRGQDAQGVLFHGSQSHDLLYTQALATMALCECLALEPANEELRKPAEMAVKFCVESQSELGGWKYVPRNDSDTSVTGWMLMALQSARNAKIEVPDAAFDKIGTFLDGAAKGPALPETLVDTTAPGEKGPPIGSRYAYMIGDNYDHVMTAEGLLCRMYLGWGPNDERVRNGCNYLLTESPPNWDERDVYYWYYGTQLMFHMEGDYWNTWNRTLRDLLVTRQEKAGPERGSWNPMGTGGGTKGADVWSMAHRGGRLYVTCFSTYMLEVYYRHLPLYSELKKQMEARLKNDAAAEAKP